MSEADKLLASVVELDTPPLEGEIGRITLPLAGTITDADANAIAGYAHMVGAAAGIILDGHATIVDRQLARELFRTCQLGIEAIVTEHTTATVETEELSDETS